jgi:integrase
MPKPIPGFTWSAKARGWYRSYRNRPLYCGGAKATREQVEKNYARKRDAADNGERQPVEPAAMTLRDAISLYIAALEHRRDSGKPRRLSWRTFHNNVEAANKFGAFVGGDRQLDQITPADFSDYARKYGGWKHSGFDSVVCRVGTFMRWCRQMKYITEYEPGPAFQRPEKQDVQDDRIARTRAFTATEIALLYAAANPTIRCWIGLGICCAFNNSDIAHLTRDAVDLEQGIIDFRRRKTGRVRRVCPLPADVVADLSAYHRPEPQSDRDENLFFISTEGNAYARSRTEDGGKPSNTISRLFARLIADTAGVAAIAGRNFAGLRTSFANLAPPGYRDAVENVMGHAHGTVLLDHYMETLELTRSRFVVDHVWGRVVSARASSASPPSPSNQ